MSTPANRSILGLSTTIKKITRIFMSKKQNKMKALWQVQILSVNKHKLYIELTEKNKLIKNNIGNSQRSKTKH